VVRHHPPMRQLRGCAQLNEGVNRCEADLNESIDAVAEVIDLANLRIRLTCAYLEGLATKTQTSFLEIEI
jgi:hypothetical protein